MNKSLFGIFITSLIVLMIIGSGCQSKTAGLQQSGSTLKVSSLTTSLGGVDGQMDRQTFKYTVLLTNTESGEVLINWVEPLLTPKVKQKVLFKETKTAVHKTVNPGQSIEVSGEFIIDTAGQTKAEIISWEPFIAGFKVNSEEELSIQ